MGWIDCRSSAKNFLLKTQRHKNTKGHKEKSGGPLFFKSYFLTNFGKKLDHEFHEFYSRMTRIEKALLVSFVNKIREIRGGFLVLVYRVRLFSVA